MRNKQEKLQLLIKLAKDESTGVESDVEKFKDNLYYTATPNGYKPIFKALIDNRCVNNCLYCINRKSSNTPRVSFSPPEFAEIIHSLSDKIFGAFISSGIYPDADTTQNKLYKTAYILRHKYNFHRYLHIKIMPGATSELVDKCVALADRVSTNMEVTRPNHLHDISKDKDFKTLMNNINLLSDKNNSAITQIMPGVVEDCDKDILNFVDYMYSQNNLSRVYYSGFRSEDNNIDMPPTSPIREKRLYQADHLIKHYDFEPYEILEGDNLAYDYDPKVSYALNNFDNFPVEINTTNRDELLKVPGIGKKTVDQCLEFEGKITPYNIDNLNIQNKSTHFLKVDGKYMGNNFDKDYISQVLRNTKDKQLSLFKEEGQ